MSKLKVSAIHDPDNDNEAITIDTSGNVGVSQTASFDGNVGIGTSSPSSNLHINNSSGDATARISAGSGSSWITMSNTSAAYIHNTSSTPTILTTGGTERMKVDASGRVTMPYQPCFYGYTSYSGGWGSSYLINPNQQRTNVGNHFLNGVFTCPVDGIYHVEGGTLVRDNSYIYIRHNGATQGSIHINSGSTGWWINISAHGYFTCSANDTLEVYSTGSVFNGNSHPWASFRLVG